MEMILIDWTQMGSTYCIAGVIQQGGGMRVVRPLWVRHRNAPVRNIGWSPFIMDGRSRWEVFELVGPEPAAPQPPHCEDTWVRNLNPSGRLATVEQRRAVLEATQAPAGRPLFGVSMTRTATCAYLTPGMGERSLTTVVLPANCIQFVMTSRPNRPEPDVRVRLDAPGFGGRLLPLKDHFLVTRAEAAAPYIEGQLRFIQEAVRAMGDPVAIRVGLSRPFSPAGGEPRCWLMADGFFSLAEPMPWFSSPRESGTPCVLFLRRTRSRPTSFERPAFREGRKATTPAVQEQPTGFAKKPQSGARFGFQRLQAHLSTVGDVPGYLLLDFAERGGDETVAAVLQPLQGRFIDFGGMGAARGQCEGVHLALPEENAIAEVILEDHAMGGAERVPHIQHLRQAAVVEVLARGRNVGELRILVGGAKDRPPRGRRSQAEALPEEGGQFSRPVVKQSMQESSQGGRQRLGRAGQDALPERKRG